MSPAYEFEDTAEDRDNAVVAKTATEKLQEVTNAILLLCSDLPTSRRLVPSEFVLTNLQKSFTFAQATAIRKAISFVLATDMHSMLRDMVREGMARIVIKNGKIKTKLTFNVATTGVAAQQKAELRARELGELLRRHAGRARRRLLRRQQLEQGDRQHGQRADVRRDHDEHEEMIGEVEINFQTETFASRDIAPSAES